MRIPLIGGYLFITSIGTVVTIEFVFDVITRFYTGAGFKVTFFKESLDEIHSFLAQKGRHVLTLGSGANSVTLFYLDGCLQIKTENPTVLGFGGTGQMHMMTGDESLLLGGLISLKYIPPKKKFRRIVRSSRYGNVFTKYITLVG